MDNQNNFDDANVTAQNNYEADMNNETSSSQTAYQQPGYQQTTYQQPNYQQNGYQQPNYQQVQYQQPNYQNGSVNYTNYNQSTESINKPSETVGVWGWIGYFVLLGLTSWIPLIGLVVVIMLAFIPGKESRKNYGKALLIIRIVTIVVVAVAVILVFVLGVGVGGSFIEYITHVQSMMDYYY